MQLRPTLLSKSAIAYVNKNYDRDFEFAYLFSRTLAAQFKHPIILDYKSQLNNIRLSLTKTNSNGKTTPMYSDKQFRILLNNTLKNNLARVEGNHLRLLSNTEDRKFFKQSKKNDYRRTTNPKEFRILKLTQDYTFKQVSKIASKQNQNELVIQTSDFSGQLLNLNPNTINYTITASCRAIQRLLKLSNPLQAKKILDRLHESKMITLKKNKTPITQEQAFDLMRKGCRKNVRFDYKQQQYYVVTASEIKLNYTLKRIKPSKWDLMTEQEQVMYSEMGYNKEYFNTL